MKTINSKMAAFSLGEDIVMAGVASIILTDNTQHLPENLKGEGYKKYMIGGAIVTDSEIPISGQWDMMECEVIIIPKKLYHSFKEGDGSKMEYILTNGYSKPESWEMEVKF